MPEKKDRKSRSAKLAPSEVAAEGGRARAKALTTEKKKEIARQGARARWKDKPIRAVYSGKIRLGAAEIPCANLADGQRVLSESAIMQALGRSYSGYYSQRDAAAELEGEAPAAEAMHRSIAPGMLRPFVPAALATLLVKPIPYVVPGQKGGPSKGIPAEALPLILETWIKAREAGALTPRQRETADKAEILQRGFQNVGIAALIDEATGAQYERARFALAQLLEAYVTKELAAWEKTFEDDFYKEMFRLRGWKVEDFRNRPGVVGKDTADIVYRRLAPGVLRRLEELVPRDDKGRLRMRLHQALTRDRGYMALKEHLASVTTIMKLADDWQGFKKMLDRVHPRYDDQLLLPFMTKGQPTSSPADEESSAN